MSIALADAQVTVNDEPISIVPNSITFTEGLGEQTMRAASTGGGSVEQVYATNVETNFAMVNFAVYNDIDSIENLRIWKVNQNNNVITITGGTPDGKTITRTFQQAAILNDPEINLGADTQIDIEFKTSQAV